MESLQFAERQGLSWLHPTFEKAGFVLGAVCVCVRKCQNSTYTTVELSTETQNVHSVL